MVRVEEEDRNSLSLGFGQKRFTVADLMRKKNEVFLYFYTKR